jgi:hypothetical protein
VTTRMAHPFMGESPDRSDLTYWYRAKRKDAAEYRCSEHPELGWFYDLDWGQHVRSHGPSNVVRAEWRKVNAS